jgi:hypothetical protein
VVVFDRKAGCKLRVHRRIALGHSGNGGRLRPALELAAKLGYVIFRPNRVNFDATVLQIPGEAGQPEARGRALCKITVADTLDDPTYEKSPSDKLIIQGYENLCFGRLILAERWARSTAVGAPSFL